MEPTPNTRNKFFRKLLIDVKNNDLEAVKNKMERAKELFDGKSYGILESICKHARDDIFQIMVNNIGPFQSNYVGNMYVKCFHESKLGKLEILMDRYRDIYFNMSRLYSGNSDFTKELFAVLEVLSKRPKQTMHARSALIEFFRQLKYEKCMKKYCCDYNTRYNYEDLAYKLISVPEFFREHDLVVVFLMFSRCEDAKRLLEHATPSDQRVLKDFDTREIYIRGNVEAIKLLLKYYYPDAFLNLNSDIIKKLFGRLDMYLLTELFDMLSQKNIFPESVEEWFQEAFVCGQVTNVNFLHERFPDVDITVFSITYESRFGVRWADYIKVAIWSRKMFPNRNSVFR